MNEEALETRVWERGIPVPTEKSASAEHLYLLDLIRVLRPHPAGLRRWSIMRAIRKHREAAGLPIPQKFEDAVERAFRNHCADSENFKKREKSPDKALFHWPQGKLGGVWAVHAERAEAWLKAEGAGDLI